MTCLMWGLKEICIVTVNSNYHLGLKFYYPTTRFKLLPERTDLEQNISWIGKVFQNNHYFSIIQK